MIRNTRTSLLNHKYIRTALCIYPQLYSLLMYASGPPKKKMLPVNFSTAQFFSSSLYRSLVYSNALCMCSLVSVCTFIESKPAPIQKNAVRRTWKKCYIFGNAKKSSTAVCIQHTQTHTFKKNPEKWEMETHIHIHTDTESYRKSWKNCSNEKILECLHSIDGKSEKKKIQTVHRMCAPKFKHALVADKEKERERSLSLSLYEMNSKKTENI